MPKLIMSLIGMILLLSCIESPTSSNRIYTCGAKVSYAEGSFETYSTRNSEQEARKQVRNELCKSSNAKYLGGKSCRIIPITCERKG